jgi:hypothetical protein
VQHVVVQYMQLASGSWLHSRMGGDVFYAQHALKGFDSSCRVWGFIWLAWVHMTPQESGQRLQAVCCGWVEGAAPAFPHGVSEGVEGQALAGNLQEPCGKLAEVSQCLYSFVWHVSRTRCVKCGLSRTCACLPVL